MVSYFDFSERFHEIMGENVAGNRLLKEHDTKVVIKNDVCEVKTDLFSPEVSNLDDAMALTLAKVAENIDNTVKRYKLIQSYFHDLCIPENCYTLFSESLVAYLNYQNLLAISSIGMLAESMLVHTFEQHFENRIEDSKTLEKRVKAFENVSQYERINVLFSLGIISEEVSQMLHQIRENRNKVIHPNPNSINFEKVADDMFILMLKILKKYTLRIRQS